MDMQDRETLQRQVDDIARRYDTPTPGLAMAPERVLDERERSSEGEPFGRWLLVQRDRGDWIDHLATAARADRGFPKNGTVKEVGDRMQILGADADAFEQLEDAERVWSSL